MEHENLPPTEEPTQEAKPWQDRFYTALLTAFPNPLFHRLVKEGSKDIVSWTSDGHRFFFSWHALEDDEEAFERINQDMQEPSDTISQHSRYDEYLATQGPQRTGTD